MDGQTGFCWHSKNRVKVQIFSTHETELYRNAVTAGNLMTPLKHPLSFSLDASSEVVVCSPIGPRGMYLLSVWLSACGIVRTIIKTKQKNDLRPCSAAVKSACHLTAANVFSWPRQRGVQMSPVVLSPRQTQRRHSTKTPPGPNPADHQAVCGVGYDKEGRAG